MSEATASIEKETLVKSMQKFMWLQSYQNHQAPAE
jgi:hypothetical protein